MRRALTPRSAAALILIAVATTLAACGGSDEEDAPSTAANTNGQSASGNVRPGVELPSEQEADGGQGAAEAVEAAPEQSATSTFLPLEAETTPDGDPIIREAATPVFGRGWGTNWGVRTVELSELNPGGPPRDGIPSIDDPQFISVEEADAIYEDNSPVIRLEINGEVRAYGLDILTWHEIVNDEVGGVPVAVTFCPLCNTAIAFDRRINGETFEFGTSGLLRNSDLVMYDRTTESLWQQIGTKAIVGDMVGAKLTVLPASIVSWEQFRESAPDGRVLSRDTGFNRSYGTNPYTGYDNANSSPFLFRGQVDDRLSAMERVVTIETGEGPVAYPFALLADVRVVNDRRDGQDIVVFWTPGTASALDTREITEGRDIGATGVFERTVDGRTLTFAPSPDDPSGGLFVDEETESRWNVLGEATAGPLAGTTLTPVVHANHFWFSWAAFQPETEVVTRA